MTTPTEDTAGEQTTGQTAAITPPRVRASSTGQERSIATSPAQAAITTAEIPVVTGAPRPIAPRGSSRSRQTRRRPRREPAPLVLRAVVWLLVLFSLIGAVGLILEHAQPSWLAFLRNAAPSNQIPLQHNAPATLTPPRPTLTAGAQTATSATYAVSVSTYSIILTTTEPCYVVVHSPASAKAISFAATVQPRQSPKSFAISGSSSIVLAARAQSITIKHGTTTLGTITSPKLGVTYTFQPSAP